MLAGMRPNAAEFRASNPGVPEREMQMIPSSSSWEGMGERRGRILWPRSP